MPLAILTWIVKNPAVMGFALAATLLTSAVGGVALTTDDLAAHHTLKATQSSLEAAQRQSAVDQATLAQEKADASQRAADAAAALTAAQGTAKAAASRATTIQAAQPSKPDDLCASAQALIAQTLNSETK